MGKTVALEGASLAFAREVFSRYYRTHPPPAPLQLPHRELAFAPFSGGGMRRHLCAPSSEALGRLLVQEVPRHTYYSSAYYQHPDHPIMVSKGWEGADVIFDLDADHLEGAESLTYPQQLERVHQQFLLLLGQFIFKDFGLEPSEVQLVFSGGRGYHAHIQAARFLGLSSGARRELVEYLSGAGFDPTIGRTHLTRRAPRKVEGTPGNDEGSEAPWDPTLQKMRKRRTRHDSLPQLAPLDGDGWESRLTRSLVQLFEELEPLPPDQASKELLRRAREVGVQEMTLAVARETVHELYFNHKFEKLKEHLTLDIGGDPPLPLLQLAKRLGEVELRGETDAPVTTDIHRLIRLPGSLHGGTGFRVLPLTVDEVRSFSPLRDALLETSPQDPAVAVQLTTKVDYPLGESRVQGQESERLELPVPQALFLVLRGEAVVSPSASAG